MKKGLSQNVQFAILGAGFLVMLMIGYFLLISPQRSSIASLKKEIASTQTSIDEARAEQVRAKHAMQIKVADLFRLTKAMPDRIDQADMVLELSQTAEQAGISFDSIKPGPPVPESGYEAIPVELIFQGNYYALSDFLFRLRNLVDVHRGALDATGRLFTIDKISFDEGEPSFPQIQAKLNVVAFVYGTGAPAAPATPAATTPPAPTASATPATVGGNG